MDGRRRAACVEGALGALNEKTAIECDDLLDRLVLRRGPFAFGAVRHLPADRRARSTWRRVAADIEAAADGGDIEGAAIALRLVLMLEGVECRPQ